MKNILKTQPRKSTSQFYSNGQPLEYVQDFLYLGRVINEDYDDDPSIKKNLMKVKQRWVQILRLLTREGATTRTMGTFYLSIIQSTLLYGSETWVISQRMHNLLYAFHHKVERHITNRHICKLPDDKWHYPNMNQTRKHAGLKPLKTDIEYCRNNLIPYAKSQAIYRKCIHNPTRSKRKYWWTTETQEN